MNRDPYLEYRVLTADPLELVHLLYQHVLDMVGEARERLRAGDIAGRSKAICRAIAALSELEGSLDHAQGGEISRNLARLYRYISARLTVANIRQEDAPLAQVQALLAPLAEAWSTLHRERQNPKEATESWAVEPAPEGAANPFFAGAYVESGRHEWSV